MINNAIERFKVSYSRDGEYAVYYKNKNGSCYIYEVLINRLGCEVIGPNRKISSNAYEFAKPHGIQF